MLECINYNYFFLLLSYYVYKSRFIAYNLGYKVEEIYDYQKGSIHLLERGIYIVVSYFNATYIYIKSFYQSFFDTAISFFLPYLYLFCLFFNFLAIVIS